MRHFEFSEGSSNKFWEIDLQGDSLVVRWGKIGTAGQSQTKSFASEARSQLEHDKLIAEKLGKGYQETGGAAPGTPAPRAAAPAPEAAPAPAVQATATALLERPASDQALHWSPSARKRILPYQGMSSPPTAPRTDRKKARALLEELRNIITCVEVKHFDPAFQALAEPVKARFADVTGPLHENPEVEAGLAVCLALNDPFWSRADDVGTAVVHLWCAERGVVFATRALAATFGMGTGYDSPGNSRGSFLAARGNKYGGDRTSFGPLKTLRALLAASSPGDYALAREAVAPLFATAPNFVRCNLAFLFPDREDWAEQAFDEGPEISNLVNLMASLRDLGRLGTIATRLAAAPGYIPSVPLEVVPTMVDRVGPPAWKTVHVLVSAAEKADNKRFLADSLLAIHWPEVADVFAGLLKDKVLGAQANEFFQAAPEVGLPVLAAQKSSEAQALVQRLAAANPEAARAALGQADGAAQRQLEQKLASQQAQAAVPVAPSSALPPSLAAPPWLGSGSQKLPVVKALSVPGGPEEVRWAPGEREKALGKPEVHHGKDEDKLFALFEEFRAKQKGWFVERLLQFSNKDRAVKIWSTYPPDFWNPYDLRGDDNPALGLLAFLGLEAVDGLLGVLKMAPDNLHVVLSHVSSPRLAQLFAEALQGKKQKVVAQQWLTRNVRIASLGLVPSAVGPHGKARQTAENALRYLASKGHRDMVLHVAGQEFGAEAREAVSAVLSSDPRLAPGIKVPARPAWLEPAALPPVQLKAGGRLSPEAVGYLLTMLSLSTLEDPLPCLAEVCQACTQVSLSEFAWDLFSAWLNSGAPSKDAWTYHALGLIGGDEGARRLTPMLRKWPGEGFSSRAADGLEVLASIGSDLALMHLNSLAEKLRFKALQDKARAKITALAEERGLTVEELADRLAPDLDLEADGSRKLDFGPRQFRVGFDEQLRPFVLDEAGKRQSDLPRPGKTDDSALASEAQEVWKALKKDVKAVASSQLARLEVALMRRRRWSVENFRMFMVDHPLVLHLTRRLVWGSYDESGKLTGTFRVAEDRSLADMQDRPFEPGGKVGLVHPLELSQEAIGAWARLLGDYELLQPFAQLGRPVFRPTPAEARSNELTRFADRQVKSGAVLGLENRGWRRGYVESAVLTELLWPCELGEVALQLDPGVCLPEPPMNPVQTALVLKLPDQHLIAELDPVTFSELCAAVEQLTPA
ncbi:DUF4132 domain-containing protein [bacterium CPR1]|nr:DUF4132 domain-containing protein [bacterium CPR1]